MKAAVPCGFRAAAGFAASRPRALDADGIPPAPSRAGPVQEYIDPQNVPPAEELRGIRSVRDYEASFAKFAKQLRESGTCSQCGSSSRQRQMALILRRRIHARPLDRPIEFPHGFRTCNAESNGPLHERRSKLPGGVRSESFGDRDRSGDVVKGIRHEDLQRPSFRDASADVVLSSWVLAGASSCAPSRRPVATSIPGRRPLPVCRAASTPAMSWPVMLATRVPAAAHQEKL